MLGGLFRRKNNGLEVGQGEVIAIEMRRLLTSDPNANVDVQDAAWQALWQTRLWLDLVTPTIADSGSDYRR
jgi:hypothetical protein